MDLKKCFDNIIKSYGIVDYTIQKVRSVYKVNSRNKILLIKKFNSKSKLFNTKRILNHLKQNNFNYIQDICYNLENNFYFEINNRYYACFTWIDGREVNLKNYKEIEKCTKTIYLFHEAVKNINDSFMILKDTSNYIENFEKDILNLYDIKNKILSKNYMDELDKLYFNNIESVITRISKIIELLLKNKFRTFLNENKTICHNSLYYQNFILSKNKTYLIDFGGILLGNRIYDLSRFSRRVFYKNKFDFRILNEIYNIYNKYYKFNDIEDVLFNVFLQYPYKFVKLGYRFYIKNKEMDKNILLNKLKKYCKYELDF